MNIKLGIVDGNYMIFSDDWVHRLDYAGSRSLTQTSHETGGGLFCPSERLVQFQKEGVIFMVDFGNIFTTQDKSIHDVAEEIKRRVALVNSAFKEKFKMPDNFVSFEV